MLLAILWRVLFDVENLRWLLAARKPVETVKYFTYGGNLDPETLRKRFITPISERPFILKDFRIAFSHTGPWKGGGFATTEESPGDLVYGKLYLISLADSRRLDFYEAVPVLKRYRRISVTQDGEEIFFYQSANPRKGLKPTAEYLASIVQGLSKLPMVPSNYLDGLKATPCLLEKKPADDIGFAYEIKNWMPSWLKSLTRRLDQQALYFYAHYLREYSLTEWLVKRTYLKVLKR
jgi:hypothetical protein